jgi:hypothetical protein
VGRGIELVDPISGLPVEPVLVDKATGRALAGGVKFVAGPAAEAAIRRQLDRGPAFDRTEAGARGPALQGCGGGVCAAVRMRPLIRSDRVFAVVSVRIIVTKTKTTGANIAAGSSSPPLIIRSSAVASAVSPKVFLAPVVKRPVRNAGLPANLRDGDAILRLFQDEGDLRFGELARFHGTLLGPDQGS